MNHDFLIRFVCLNHVPVGLTRAKKIGVSTFSYVKLCTKNCVATECTDETLSNKDTKDEGDSDNELSRRYKVACCSS